MLFTLPVATISAQELQLNGMAIHSELRRDYYIGALFVAVPNSSSEDLLSSEQDKQMVLRVLAARWSARSFEQHWTQSILINNDEEDLANFAESVLRFTGSVGGKLVNGDEVIISSKLGGALTMSVNGVNVFSLESGGNEFFSLLLNAWIGARPPSSQFKGDILTAPGDVTNLRTIFDNLTYTDERVEEVRAWNESGDQLDNIATESTPTTETNPPPAPTKPSAAEIAKRAAARAAAAAAAAKAQAEAEAEAAAKLEAEKKAEEERLAKEVEQKNAGLRLLYRSNVMKMIYGRVVYPSRSIDRDQEGEVVLKVILRRNGELVDASVDKESEHNLLNKAALRAVELASPFPNAPEKLTDKQIELLIPIRFQIPR
ncbi:MAG: TonB family protein [Pseudomonadales bacterium]